MNCDTHIVVQNETLRSWSILLKQKSNLFGEGNSVFPIPIYLTGTLTIQVSKYVDDLSVIRKEVE